MRRDLLTGDRVHLPETHGVPGRISGRRKQTKANRHTWISMPDAKRKRDAKDNVPPVCAYRINLCYRAKEVFSMVCWKSLA